jgi:hypothetical protein
MDSTDFSQLSGLLQDGGVDVFFAGKRTCIEEEGMTAAAGVRCCDDVVFPRL